MLFNSYIFVLLFLPMVLWVWWRPAFSTSGRLIALTLASYFFYGWWDYRFVGLLLFSTVIDYYIGKRLHLASSPSSRWRWLIASLTSNLCLLGFFKYCGFFASSWNAVADWLRTGGAIPVPEIILPVGISFYTFQTISYTIDIFRREAKPTDSLWHFAAYVSLFPQLIAGPIVRYGALEKQLRSIPQKPNWDQFAQGISFFVAGMCQKVLLADTIASRINPMFDDYGQLRLIGAWFAMLGYTCQLYFDFCGYSNMAVGLGRMLGFEFPQNFDSPYKSASISEFWRRWHITLSSWLRDYLFIPLGGSHHGQLITLRNLTIVMFLGGLWHGAGWTFVVWGLFHGALLAIHSLARHSQWIPIPRIVGVALTFLCVVVGWTIFRSVDLAMCGQLLGAMFGWQGWETNFISAVGGATSLAILTVLLTIIFCAPNLWQIELRPNFPSAALLSILFVVCVLRFDSESPFLYFQF